eukprot:1185146-Prorocentrum_minimum.AAC.5
MGQIRSIHRFPEVRVPLVRLLVGLLPLYCDAPGGTGGTGGGCHVTAAVGALSDTLLTWAEAEETEAVAAEVEVELQRVRYACVTLRLGCTLRALYLCHPPPRLHSPC